jgi:mannose/fructose/N-acetylgalactosamine-specific phosphotransferase system component IIC
MSWIWHGFGVDAWSSLDIAGLAVLGRCAAYFGATNIADQPPPPA